MGYLIICSLTTAAPTSRASVEPSTVMAGRSHARDGCVELSSF